MVAPAEKILNRNPRSAGRGGGMDILSMNQNHPRNVPYSSNSYFPNSEFSRHGSGRANGANTYQFVLSNPVALVYPRGLDSWGPLPPNYQPIPNFPQVPTVGQVFSQTVGGWASDVGGFFGSIGHSISYGAQGFWDITTGNQQFMNALSPHDQPMPAYNELKNMEQQMKSARGCPTYLNNLGQQIAQAEKALQLEQAANAENAAALQAGVDNLINSEQQTDIGLTGLAFGVGFGDIQFLVGLTDAGA
jgi:hypothetical protein